MNQLATLRMADQAIILPIATRTEGEQVLDVTTLHAQTGLATFDPWYVNTASCSSTVTFLDRDKGFFDIAAFPLSNWPNIRIFWRPPTF